MRIRAAANHVSLDGRLLPVIGAVFLACLVHAFPSATAASAQETRALKRVPAPVGPQGTVQEMYTGSFALLVGVSRYDHGGAWPALPTIPVELQGIAAALNELGFDRVDTLLDPTGSELRQRIEDFIEQHGHTEGHRLVFFFSGHGFTLDNGKRGYFVPRDAPDPNANEASFRRIALSMDQVLTWSREFKARHALFAFDSCFSGTIFGSRGGWVPERLSELTRKPVREFLAAGEAHQRVPAASVFTPVFVRGLRGAADLNQDGFVTGTELGNFVQREVMNAIQNQTPHFGKAFDFAEGDLVFVVPEAQLNDRDGVLAVLNAYRVAYESMDAAALLRVFPSFSNPSALKSTFADLRSVAVAMSPASAQLSIPGDGTATVACPYSVTFTSRTGSVEIVPRRPARAQFHLRKVSGKWIIERIEFK